MMLGAANHRDLHRVFELNVGREFGCAARLDHGRGTRLRYSIMPLPSLARTSSGVFSPRIKLPASLTASMILTYPVQRHRLRASPRLIAASLGFGFWSSRTLVAMIMPGVQYPHWMAPDSVGFLDEMRIFGSPQPSTVITSAPSRSATLRRQESTALPFKITVQAPHCPLRSQPCLVPSGAGHRAEVQKQQPWGRCHFLLTPLIVSVTFTSTFHINRLSETTSPATCSWLSLNFQCGMYFRTAWCPHRFGFCAGFLYIVEIPIRTECSPQTNQYLSHPIAGSQTRPTGCSHAHSTNDALECQFEVSDSASSHMQRRMLSHFTLIGISWLS